jgi:hypothetical protein
MTQREVPVQLKSLREKRQTQHLPFSTPSEKTKNEKKRECVKDRMSSFMGQKERWALAGAARGEPSQGLLEGSLEGVLVRRQDFLWWKS